MTGRAAAFVAKIAVLPAEPARLRAGVAELESLYRDLIRAAAPPNPQFERERIIAQAPNPRELVFVFGLTSEGENEAALLLELIASVLAAEPGAPVAHIADEAWYYLRTSIDREWQLDDGSPCLSAALAYLYGVLCERLERLLHDPPAALRPPADPLKNTALLRSLRDDFT